MENPDGHAGAEAGAGLGSDPCGLPPPPPPPLDGLSSDPAKVLPPPPPYLPPYNGAQAADGSAYPAEHASLNGTSGEVVAYPAAGATENAAADDVMAEPMPWRQQKRLGYGMLPPRIA